MPRILLCSWKARCPHRGLTVVEALVLLLIFLLLAGFVLVYVQQARQSAAQASCANNLRILGQGIYYFQGEIPRALLEEGIPGPPLPAARIAPGYATWAVQLAPYIAAGHPLARWDLRQSYFDQPAEIRRPALPLFLCPARQRPALESVSGDVAAGTEEHVPGAVGDYACAAGDGDPQFPWDSEKANGPIILGEVLHRHKDMILRWQSRTDFASLGRGLSNTILLGEKHVPQGSFGEAGQGDGSLYNGANPASFSRVGGPGFGLAQSPDDPFNRNFGSYHPGICQFLLADDSVRPLANNVSPEVLGRLIRRE